MRATRIIALAILLTLWIPALILPLPGWAYILPVLLTGGVIAAAYLYEVRTTSGHAESRRRVLDRSIQTRMLAAMPEQQRGIAAMQEDFKDAVNKITGAIPGQGPRAAIDAIPWYLVIGHTESGKSSALATSGQAFAYVTPAGGARGNRGCRWWLSNEAAFIDTAGAYAEGEGGYAEWLAFLKQLGETRPLQPLHGIFVVVAADRLSTARPEDIDLQARQTRERLDEAFGFLGIQVPVYLIVTRCDLLPGFLEFFADLKDNERGQVWGFNFALHGPKEAPRDRVGRFFDELAEIARERALRRLRPRAQTEVRAAVFQFPHWFRSMRANLVDFAGAVFAHNTYQDEVMARGVYFSSASEPAGIYGDQVTRLSNVERGFFLRDLFTTVVPLDREYARPAPSELRRRLHRKLSIATPLFGLSLVTAVLSLHAYSANMTLVEDLRATLNACAAARAPVPIGKLDLYRAQVARLQDYRDNGAPLHMTLGMYVGNMDVKNSSNDKVEQLEVRAATLYAALVYRDVSNQIVDVTYRDLTVFGNRYVNNNNAPSSEEAFRYGELLRLYLMLTTPRQPDDPADSKLTEANNRNWFTRQIVQRWQANAPTLGRDDQSLLAMTAIIDLYARVLAADERLGFHRGLDVAARVRRILDRLPRGG